MNYPRRELKQEEYYPGRRVYISYLDVFGRLQIANLSETANDATVPVKWNVVCEDPMPQHVHELWKQQGLYKPKIFSDAIGERDSYNPEGY